MFKTTSRNSV